MLLKSVLHNRTTVPTGRGQAGSLSRPCLAAPPASPECRQHGRPALAASSSRQQVGSARYLRTVAFAAGSSAAEEQEDEEADELLLAEADEESSSNSFADVDLGGLEPPAVHYQKKLHIKEVKVRPVWYGCCWQGRGRAALSSGATRTTCAAKCAQCEYHSTYRVSWRGLV